MPDRPSSAVKETVTSSSYQPAPLGARSGAPVIVGAVLSMLTVAVAFDPVAGVVGRGAGDLLGAALGA